MGAVGFTTSIPIEVLLAAGKRPVDLNNAFISAPEAHAFVRGRWFVNVDDVKLIAHDVLRHRILVSYEAEAENKTSEDLIDRILGGVEVP